MQAPAHSLPDDQQVVLAITTLGVGEDSAAFARALVERKLVACANVLAGVRSCYWWEGKVVEEGEQLVLMKLTRARVAALRAAMPVLHPYDVPELLVFDVLDGLPAYMAWVVGAMRQ